MKKLLLSALMLVFVSLSGCANMAGTMQGTSAVDDGIDRVFWASMEPAGSGIGD